MSYHLQSLGVKHLPPRVPEQFSNVQAHPFEKELNLTQSTNRIKSSTSLRSLNTSFESNENWKPENHAIINIIKVYLRHDQTFYDQGLYKYLDPKVTTFAPSWVERCLMKLGDHIHHGTSIKVLDKFHNERRLEIGPKMTMRDLLIISRNESYNVTGVINFALYGKLDRSIILSIKDLVRQCAIIGMDETVSYGGYGINPIVIQKEPVVVIDLIALQFQQHYNSGRLVLVGSDIEHGLLDEELFFNVVGEHKKSFDEVKEDKTGRYKKRGDVFFDILAYKKFVENDFLLACLGLHKMNLVNVNLKFLKYGCGFFAGPYLDILDENISEGIYNGMVKLFNMGTNQIKAFEFCFYSSNDGIARLCRENGVECQWSREDSLKSSQPSLMTASTNCSDPHSVTGNEMHYSSIDATISENIVSKGHKFSPVINTQMQYEFIDV